MGLLTTLGPVRNILLGQTAAKAAFLGSAKIWARSVTYQVTKAGNQGGTGTGWLQLSGLAADPAFPGTVVSGDNIQIPAGASPYTAHIRMEVPHTGGISPRYGQCQLLRGGAVLAEGAQVSSSPGTSWAEWTGTVNPGDVIVAKWRGEGNLFSRPTAQAGAFVRITPI